MKPRLNWRGMSLALILCGPCAVPASALTLCTVVADAVDGRVLQQRGQCAERYTPASTFKLPLALMGFDAGILQDEHTPAWPFLPGYPAWGGEPWRQPVDPARWIHYSRVLVLAAARRAQGQDRLQQYTSAFQYGNRGCLGRTRQAERHAGCVVQCLAAHLAAGADRLPAQDRQPAAAVSAHAYDMAERLFAQEQSPDGWRVYGKTGTGSPGSDGSYDRDHAYGWFVGWAEKGERKLVFARLIQDGRPDAERGRAGTRRHPPRVPRPRRHRHRHRHQHQQEGLRPPCIPIRAMGGSTCCAACRSCWCCSTIQYRLPAAGHRAGGNPGWPAVRAVARNGNTA